MGLEGAAAGVCESSPIAMASRSMPISEHPDGAAKGNLPVSLPRVARSPAECRQAWRVETRPRLSERSRRHHQPDSQGLGAGFDPHEAMRGPGLGLTSMKERLKVVGGQLSIHSQRGRGTTIHAVAPLRSRRSLQA